MLEPKQSRLIVVPHSCLHGFQEVWSLSQREGLRERGKWGGRHIAQTGGGRGATKESPVNYIQWEGLWRRLGPCRASVLGREKDSTQMYIAHVSHVSTKQYSCSRRYSANDARNYKQFCEVKRVPKQCEKSGKWSSVKLGYSTHLGTRLGYLVLQGSTCTCTVKGGGCLFIVYQCSAAQARVPTCRPTTTTLLLIISLKYFTVHL